MTAGVKAWRASLLAEYARVIRAVSERCYAATPWSAGYFELAAVTAFCQVVCRPLCSLPQKILRQGWQGHAEAVIHQPALQAPAVLLSHFGLALATELHEDMICIYS